MTALTLPGRAVLDAPAMEATGPVKALLSALSLAGALGCTSSSPVDAGGSDAGGTDAGEADAGDVPLFVGPGDLNVTWTLNGRPPATECAAAEAAFVEIQATFGAATRLPCTQGMFSVMMLPANRLNVGARLLRADGSPIYEYVIPTTIVSDQTVDATINFEPPGSFRVRWTVNGNAPGAECPTTTASDVVVRVEGFDGLRAPCGLGRISYTRLPGARLEGVQPGRYPLTGQIRSGTGGNARVLQELTAEVEVRSGAVSEVVLAFEAPPLPVDE